MAAFCFYGKTKLKQNTNRRMNNIAIFIDGDNISGHHYQTVLNDMKQEGRVLIQRVYADFSQPSSKNWQEVILNNGMEAIQTYRVAKKESTDNALIVDCMDTLYNITTIQKYVIVSSDSDFSSLATKIRLKGLFCIGVGYHHTALKLRNNCDKFVLIEPLLERSIVSMNDDAKLDPPRDVQKTEPVPDATKTYDLSHGMEAFLASVYKHQSSNVISVTDVMAITKKYQLKDIIKLRYIQLYKNNLYYLLEGPNNMRDVTLNILLKADRDMIHMSYLKDYLLNSDSSFDQRRYGFYKMADYAEMIIHNTEWTLSKDKQHNVVIVST
jgi:uncharacterized LabA/DUF88 family protein